VIMLAPASLLGAHELSIRYYQDTACTLCHEMKAPVQKWKDSGTAKNHKRCVDCHSDTGFAGWLDMNEKSAKFLVKHFTRNSGDPIKPPEEPLFWEGQKEAGYWSLVPNHRCFQCHDAKNHKELDQQRIHAKLIANIDSKPCKDCHNHEMYNGQKFYEKVLPDQIQVAKSSNQT
jgi:nitrate/TMAO reductase-like tetraheme cytochrome c subunit